jgi:hypothetical protein
MRPMRLNNQWEGREMSVELVGSEGFRYQDLVTAWVALQTTQLSGAALYPEKRGGEDAELSFGCSTGTVSLEIQVKGQRSSQISLPFLVNVLAHFPSRKSSDCLLERLLDDHSRYLVLVVRQRCEDSVSVFLNHDLLPAGPNSKISTKDAESVVQELAQWNPYPGNKLTKLALGRIEACKTLAKRSTADMVDALSRVRIIEKVEQDDLLERCTFLLRRFSIPEDRAADTIRELTEAITEAHAPQADALLAIRSILERRSGPTLNPKGYVARGQEEAWKTTLSSRNVLLLSGQPRCGKSDAARSVGHFFQMVGYDVRTGSDMDTARSFLEDSIAPRRVFILDDPLEQGGEVHLALATLYKLVRGAGPNRKVIVTQSYGALFEARGRRTLQECSIEGIHHWHDLSTPPSPEFVTCAWSNIATLQAIPHWLKGRIHDGILSGQIDLELGCLRHLASIAEDIPESATIDEISGAARQQAEQLSLSLVGRSGMEEVLIALAAGTTVELKIHEAELRFILAEKLADERPSLRRGLLGTMYSMGANLPEAPQFPEYINLDPLSAGHHAALGFLEKRRYVERDEDGYFNISLPFYRAAANEALRSTDRLSIATARRIVDRCLFCLSPRTSRAAARNLAWVVKSTAIAMDDWFDMLTSVVKSSMFPATKDLCLEALIRLPGLGEGDIDADTRERRQAVLEDCLRSVTAEDLKVYRWRSGEAWLVREGMDHHEFSFGLTPSVDTKRLEHLRSRIEDPKRPLPTPEEAVMLLESSMEDGYRFSEQATLQLLRYDERFLRAKAAKLWLFRSPNPRGTVWNTIREDGHLAMTIAAIDGLIKGWHVYEPHTRSMILEELAEVVTKSLSTRIVVGHLLDTYAPSEFEREDAPWQIFVRLMPDLLAHYSLSAWLNEGKVFDAIDEVKRVAPTEATLKVWDSWMTYVEARTSAGFALGEGAKSIAWMLLDITKDYPELRSQRVERLLATRGTSAATRFIRDLLRTWKLLTAQEQTFLAEVLTQDRRDAKWLLAVALTQPNMLEYENILPGKLRDFSRAKGMHALDAPGATISDAAIRMYCGSPSILSWLDLSNSPSPQWKVIILGIARDTEHPRFSIAMRTVFRTMDREVTIELLKCATVDSLPNYFHAILDAAIDESYWKDAQIWGVLLQQCEQHQFLTEALVNMALAANAILSDWDDLEGWVESERYRGLLERALSRDYAGIAVYYLHIGLQRGRIDTDSFLQQARKFEQHWKEGEFMLHFTPRNLLVVSENHADLFSEETIGDLKRQEAELEDSRKVLRNSVSGDAEQCEDWCRP